MDEIWAESAAGLARRIRAREVSAEEATRAALARIERLDGELRAFLSVDADGALAAAREVDRRLAGGDPVGPLAGVPMALKDLLARRGAPTTCGSRILEHFVSPYDATCVARLEAAGAVLVGKLNMDEFAMGSSTETSFAGATRNPWDRARVAGGSSGGSAAAVAAGLVTAALGSDTGGSIRQPASFCGVVGLKPTYGRVSRSGLVAFASSLDQVGPITRTVEDAALLLEVIAGHDPLDATSLERPSEPWHATLGRDVAGLRLGVVAEGFASGTDPEVAAIARGAIERLAEAGADLVDVTLPHTRYGVATYYVLAPAEASSNLARYDGVRFGARSREADDLAGLYRQSRSAGFGAEVKRRILIGTYVLSSGYYDAYYRRAQQVRTLIRTDYARAFERCDALVLPVAPTAAFPLGRAAEDPLETYQADVLTVGVNLAGLPGLSVPAGLTAAGLPVGLQIVAPALGEAVALRVGAAWEALSGLGGRLAPWAEEAA